MNKIFNRAIEKIYDCALNPDDWSAALQCIGDCFDDVGCILIYGRDDGAFGVLGSPRLETTVTEYVKNWSTRDIRAIRARELGFFGGRRVITDSDVVTPDEMESDPFYAQFLSAFGLKYFAATTVATDAGVEAALSAQRASTRPPYTQDELALVSVLGRHVERALQLGFRMTDNELAAETLGHVLSRVDIGIFVLDALGRVTFSNDLAQEYVGDGVELIDEKLHLRANVASNIPRLHPAPLTTLVTDGQGPILVHRQNGASPLVAHFLTVPGGLEFHQPFLTQARGVVLLSDSADSVAALLTRPS